MAESHSITSGIYVIRCIVTGKPYVGSAINVERRFREHRTKLNAGKHCNRKLQNAWDKYGKDCFAFEWIEPADVEKLIEREQFHIDRLGSTRKGCGFNICVKAGSRLGMMHSEETKARLSLSKSGRKMAPEHVARMVGRPCSDETRAKLSAARRGRKLPRAQVEKMAAAQKGIIPIKAIEAAVAARRGKPLSDERKAKLSKALKGRVLTEEHKTKIAAANMGRVVSEETREKFRNNKHTEETKAKMRGREFSTEHRSRISEARQAHAVAEKARVAEILKERLG